METIARRGLMLVLSSPSGAGKTTIARRLLDEDAGIAMSISHTTREKRKGEVDGKDYHFVDKETFSQMREKGAFLEWAVVFDNYYGTTREPVEQALNAGARCAVRRRLARRDGVARVCARRRGLRVHLAADRGRARGAA